MKPRSRRTGAGLRTARLESLLLHELQSLITDEATDPALHGIRLLSVHLSPDGGHARVAYAVIGPIEHEQSLGRESALGLGRAAGFLRTRLSQSLQLKKTPQLGFTFVGVTAGGEPCPEW
jgi:ribosome-binding factor A